QRARRRTLSGPPDRGDRQETTWLSFTADTTERHSLSGMPRSGPLGFLPDEIPPDRPRRFAPKYQRGRDGAETGNAIDDPLEIFRRRNEHLEHEAVVARHAMDLDDVGNLAEPLQAGLDVLMRGAQAHQRH